MDSKISKLSFLKNKTLVGAVCVVLAILIGFIFVPFASGLAGTPVVRAKVEIPSGTKITADMVEQVKMGRLNLPSGTTANPKDVIGKYTVTDISKSDNVTAAKVSSKSPVALKTGQMEMSVSIKNLAYGLSGKLQAGDIVAVFCPQSVTTSVNSDTIQDAAYPKELQYVKVAAVTAGNGKDTKPADYQQSSGNNSTELPATVTLVVNEKQARTLSGMDNQNIHLALVCHGSDSNAEKLLEQEDGILAAEPADSASSTTSSASSGTYSSFSKSSSSTSPSSASSAESSASSMPSTISNFTTSSYSGVSQ